MQLVLASASPRRKELLGHVQRDFVVRVNGICEDRKGDESPDEYVKRLSYEKARAVVLEQECVVGADTTVALGNEILGKPTSKEDARQILGKLSGKWHEVFTGVTVLTSDKVNTFSVCTRVLFDSMSEADIEFYVNTLEPMDKAGAYGIQGIGGAFIKKIEGSYSNVVGLPLCELRKALSEVGFC